MIGSLETSVGFHAIEFPDKTGFTWTLTSILGKFLREAEDRYGIRDRNWTPIGIEFGGDTPMVWYPGNCKNVSIMLSNSARNDPHQAIFQLAHETIHLLSPTGGRNANVLEEGLATLNSHQASQEWNLGLKSAQASYLSAEQLVLELLTINPKAVQSARQIEPSLVSFTPDLLISVEPALNPSTATSLCEKFVR